MCPDYVRSLSKDSPHELRPDRLDPNSSRRVAVVIPLGHQVRRQIRMAPPARFELALPPPESQRTMIWHDWDSTKPQVRPTLSGWSLLAELGRFRFWCCQSVANAPPR